MCYPDRPRQGPPAPGPVAQPPPSTPASSPPSSPRPCSSTTGPGYIHGPGIKRGQEGTRAPHPRRTGTFQSPFPACPWSGSGWSATRFQASFCCQPQSSARARAPGGSGKTTAPTAAGAHRAEHQASDRGVALAHRTQASIARTLKLPANALAMRCAHSEVRFRVIQAPQDIATMSVKL